MNFASSTTKKVLLLHNRLKQVNVLFEVVSVILCLFVAFRYVSLFYEYAPNYNPENKAAFDNALNLDFWGLALLAVWVIYGLVLSPFAWRIMGLIGCNRSQIVFAFVPVINFVFVKVLGIEVNRFLERD